ncbi:hypothetical protein Ais01nite_32590 [Asanoa ishikariensis]|nr:hypothetical protein Ais01nite_32590 [Asanoa ishikariensis]
MFRARLLFFLDRPDEAMAELNPLRPLLTADPGAAHEITEALMAGGRGKIANELAYRGHTRGARCPRSDHVL